MHLSEGVLHAPTLIGGALAAVAGVAMGLKRIDNQQLALTALFASAFFVAGTIHVPVGIGSVHLILNGIAGLFLGWAVFPAFLIALSLQVLLFSFGGFAVLGINLCIMALPAVAAHYLLRGFLRSDHFNHQWFAGIAAGVLGVGGSALLASIILSTDGGKDYHDLIVLLLISHLPVFVVDSAVSLGIIVALRKMYPTALRADL